MYLRSLAAGVIAAVFSIAGTGVATAADLWGPDDDPRYGGIYKHPEPPLSPRYGPYGEPSYDGLHRGKRYSHGDHLEPMPYPPAFDDYRPRRTFAAPGCVPRHEVRKELVRDGWSDLHDLEIRDEFALLTARRPNGQLYRLKIDRCDGQVVRARRIEHGEEAYAWRRREVYPAY